MRKLWILAGALFLALPAFGGTREYVGADRGGGGSGAGLVVCSETASPPGIDCPAPAATGSQGCYKEAASATHVGGPGADPDVVCFQSPSNLQSGNAVVTRTLNSDGLVACRWYEGTLDDATLITAQEQHWWNPLSQWLSVQAAVTTGAAWATCPAESGVNGCTITRVGITAIERLSDSGGQQCGWKVGVDTDQDISTIESYIADSTMYVGENGFANSNTNELRCFSADCGTDDTVVDQGDMMLRDVADFQIDQEDAYTWEVFDPDGTGGTGCDGVDCVCTRQATIQLSWQVCWVPDETK
jgi:hypothetical protein